MLSKISNSQMVCAVINFDISNGIFPAFQYTKESREREHKMTTLTQWIRLSVFWHLHIQYSIEFVFCSIIHQNFWFFFHTYLGKQNVFDQCSRGTDVFCIEFNLIWRKKTVSIESKRNKEIAAKQQHNGNWFYLSHLGLILNKNWSFFSLLIFIWIDPQ